MRFICRDRCSDEGFALFDEFSRRVFDPKIYNADYSLFRWYEEFGPDLDNIGPGYRFKIALENGWKKTAPTLDEPASAITLSEARQKGGQIIGHFLFRSSDRNCYQMFAEEIEQTVKAIRMITGGGKTALAISEIAKWLKTSNRSRLVHYIVPTRD